MKINPLQNMLPIAILSLFLSGCGGDAQDVLATQNKKSRSAVSTETLPSMLKVKRAEKTYVVTGLAKSGTRKIAIINGKNILSGEEIDPGVLLKDVQPTYAIILVGGTEHLIRPEAIQKKMDRKTRKK